MLAKRHQLRAELRGHLVQVLEERGIPTSVLSPSPTIPSSTTSASSQQEKKREYARQLQLQMEEARQRRQQQEREIEGSEDDDASIWFERRNSPLAAGSTFVKRKLSPTQQRQILFEQMEDARRRREAEERRQAEESARWEEFAMKSPVQHRVRSARSRRHPEDHEDWNALLQRNQQHIEDIERDLASLTRQLDKLKTEEAKILKYLSPQSETSASLKPQITTSHVEDAHVLGEASQPLNVTARYFVYISRTPNANSENDESLRSSFPAVAQHSLMTVKTVAEDETGSVLRDPQSAALLEEYGRRAPMDSSFSDEEDDDSDDDDEEDDEQLKSAAQRILAGTEDAAEDSEPQEDINSFIERDLFDTRSTPRSKTSYDL